MQQVGSKLGSASVTAVTLTLRTAIVNAVNMVRAFRKKVRCDSLPALWKSMNCTNQEKSYIIEETAID